VAQPFIQTSFASGEWAPKLRSRVDVQKFHAGAALLRNWYVDYSGGGASTRPGTRFINQCKSLGARLIPFQPSSTLSYVLEFGQNYIRFISNGAYILENAVTGGSAASGNDFTIANSYAAGDWVYASGWGGLTNVNGRYFIVAAGTDATDVIVTDLFGNAVTFTGAYTSGGQLQRVYTITTPYNASDLFPNPATGNPGLKWVQNVTSLIICHPTYPSAILTIVSANVWTYTAITFGPTVLAPTSVISATTLNSGSWYYGYLVTAVDRNGQESVPSTPTTLADYLYLGSTPGSNTIAWQASPGAVSYNVYKAAPNYNATIVSGAPYGFVGNVSALSFTDAYPGIDPDFSQTPPIVQNPFLGASVQSLTLGTNANYTAVPPVTIAVPSSGLQATAYATLQVNTYSITQTAVATNGNPINQLITGYDGVVFEITGTTLSFGWEITSVSIVNRGNISSGSAPSSFTYGNTNVGSGQFTFNQDIIIAVTWDIAALVLIQGGFGYTTVPAVTLSGSATATASLGSVSAGNPGVPSFEQERLVLAAQPGAIQTANLSQPGSFFNFNISNPAEDDDAVSATIISEELNDIRSMIPVPTGLILLTGKGAWLVNGGGGISTSNPITPASITATPQAFNGANDLRPLKINLDVLYGTNKGSYVRDLTYNIYANIYTGSDISVLSNHLFFNYYLLDWALAEEPFKTIWAIRNDGTMLSLGFVKEQDLIGWAHHDTNGQFTSVCSVIETVGNGNVVDAVYVIVQRLVNGNTVQYVERLADRFFPYGYEDSWSVDCALQTLPQVSPTGTLTVTGSGAVGTSVTLTDTVDAPFTSGMVGWVVRAGGGIYTITAYTSTSAVTATVTRTPTLLNPYTGVPYPVTTGYTIWEPVTTITGLMQLIGMSVTGTADGSVVPLTVVSAGGTITLTSSASKVTLGLAFVPQLQTLPLDLGEPTSQSKRKKIPSLTLRTADTLGLQVGTTFANAVTVKDLQIGAVPSQSNGPTKIGDLVNPSLNQSGPTIDAYIKLDPLWQEIGQFCIQQNLPYPATVLGVIPEVELGDTKNARAG